MFLGVLSSRNGCTWEVWRAPKQVELYNCCIIQLIQLIVWHESIFSCPGKTTMSCQQGRKRTLASAWSIFFVSFFTRSSRRKIFLLDCFDGLIQASSSYLLSSLFAMKGPVVLLSYRSQVQYEVCLFSFLLRLKNSSETPGSPSFELGKS